MSETRAGAAQAADESSGGHGVDLWGSAAWREQAVAWLDARLGEAGIQRTGEVEQPHLRPWATALRAPTTRGVFWLKAPAPGTAFEIPLYRRLAQLVPERVLAPLAIDDARAWILLPDGGATLGESLGADARTPAITRALTEYASLQRQLAGSADELVRVGVLDMRPSMMPERFDTAAAAVERFVASEGSAEDRATFERAVARRDTFVGWCRALGASPVPPSLEHNDLHPWNMFVSSGTEPIRFYDWGDSVVAHPFASLLSALGFMRSDLEAPADDPRITGVRDAYLGEFVDLEPLAELRRTAELACHVGKVARALVWQRTLTSMGPADAKPFARAPFRWFCAVLDPSPLIAGG